MSSVSNLMRLQSTTTNTARTGLKVRFSDFDFETLVDKGMELLKDRP